jgi:hypothetical protein
VELSALNSITSTAKVFAALRAPNDTSCSLQAAFLQKILVEYESIKHRRTPPREYVPAAAAGHTALQTALDRTHILQPADVISACDDQNIESLLSENLSNFDLDFANDQAWTLIFANAGFNIDQGAFLLSD